MFRKICFLIVLLAAVIATRAQLPPANKPAAGRMQATPPSFVSEPSTVKYESGAMVNAIQTLLPLEPVTIPQHVDSSYSFVKRTTKYLDGLGRPLQFAEAHEGPASKLPEIVTSLTIDDNGREESRYLPYASGSKGGFRVNTFIEQDSFYRTARLAGSEKLMYAGESHFYTRTKRESSPLERVLAVMPPGNSWAGSDRGTIKQYLVNTAADSVRVWTIPGQSLTCMDEDSSFPVPVSKEFLPAGRLEKEVRLDENGHAYVEYRNKKGQVILSKTQAGAVSAGYGAYENWLCTYYAYDDLGRLRFVLPPEAVAGIRADGTIPAAIADGLCFRYEYDRKDKLVASKSPGSGWEYFIYDPRDRLVFSQGPLDRRKRSWKATLYDALNRPVVTGMLLCRLRPCELQRRVDSIIPAEKKLEAGSLPAGKRLRVWMDPLPSGYNFTALTLTYYDDYSQTGNSYTDTYNNRMEAGNNRSPEETLTISEHSKLSAKGLLTVAYTRVIEDPSGLGSGKWLEKVNFYDRKGRIVQTVTDSYGGGQETACLRYDFAGNLISRYLVHTSKLPGKSPVTVGLATSMEYDEKGRLKKVWKAFTGSEGSKTLVVNNDCDDFGRLQTKAVGSKRSADGSYSAEPLETLDYNYHLRGWLKGINGDWSSPQPEGTGTSFKESDHWFGMELQYDWGSQEKSRHQFNGNISAITWRSSGDDRKRALGYSYDPANRLLGADFSEYSGSDYADNPKIDFDVVIGDGFTAASAYDANGNIKRMKQWGLKRQRTAVIDELTYTYYANSNKLRSIGDAAETADYNGQADFHDRNRTADDYGYDEAGNLVTDANKGLAGPTGMELEKGGAVVYNHLNLPWKLTVNNDDGSLKGDITYTYDALGNKLQKKVLENHNDSAGGGPRETVTTWLGDFVYEQVNSGIPVLQYISHEEGRIRPGRNMQGDSCWNYDYFIRDHLGNVRMVLTDEMAVHAYPAASLEAAMLDKEKVFYSIPDDASVRVNKSKVPGYPQDDSYMQPNEFVQRLNGLGAKVGTSIILRVMSGDKVNIRASSWFRKKGVALQPGENFLETLTSALAGAFTGSGSFGKLATPTFIDAAAVKHAASEFLRYHDRQQANDGRPRASLNWLLLDEQLQPVITQDGKNSGHQPVGADREFTVHQVTAREMTRNGYLYIYLSNETPGTDVFFDNLQVTHIKGPLLEENHYYPFGGRLEGICSKAAGSLRNRNLFNDGTELSSEEFSDGSGLEWYETTYRSYDPQIGRFHQMDPIGAMTENWSPYAFVHNNPVLFNDPLGLDTVRANVLLPANVQPGHVINVYNSGGGTSSYIYDPANQQADAQGLVANGMADAEMTTLAVLAVAKRTENSGGWSGVLDVVQTGIDIVGLVPVVGEVADGANALIYTARGDYKNAALSGAAMIPLAGWAATGTKLAVKTVNLTAKTRKSADALQLAERILGKGYTEIDPGVFRSADGLKQFRMTTSDLAGKGMNGVPHVHIETYNSGNLSVPTKNYHIPVKD